MKKIEEEVVAYTVFDKNGNYQASYSLKLPDCGSSPLEMARNTLGYHPGGRIEARYKNGVSEQIFP